MRTYIAVQTKSFTEGQVLADIIKDNKYQVYQEEGFFIGEFGNKIYFAPEEFNQLFRMQEYENSKTYRNKYLRERVKSINLKLFPSDQDIIDHLEKIKLTEHTKKKAGQCEYIRRLIREDMQRQKQNQ